MVVNTLYNELFTQLKALENTKASYQKGVYILSPEGSKIPEGTTSTYDPYLPEFERLYKILPESVLVSQIEEDNTNLYKFISATILRELEEFLQNYIPQDVLDDLERRGYESKKHS